MHPDFTVLDVSHPEGWEDWTLDNVTVDDRGVHLAREPSYLVPASVGEESLSDVEPIDVDTDRCGSVFVLGRDEGASERVGADEFFLYRLGPSENTFERLSCCTVDGRDAPPTALCVQGETIFVAGSGRSSDENGPNRGYVRALSARFRQTRWIVERIDDALSFSNPIRVVSGPSNREVFVLDEGTGAADGFVAGVRDDGRVRVVRRNLDRPVDLTVDDRGDLYVLDRRSGLHRFITDWSESNPAAEPEDSTAARRTGDSGERRSFQDVACLESVGAGVFVIGLTRGARSERTLLHYNFDDGSSERITGYRGGCDRLRRARSRGGPAPDLYAIGEESGAESSATPAGTGHRYLTLLTAEETVRPTGEGYVGSAETRFDLGSTETEWCRVSLELEEVPPGTRVTLSHASTASAERPAVWTQVEQPDPKSMLIQSRGDQFLWLRLELVGTRDASPIVSSLRLSYGHDSYMRYLPAIYAEDELSAEFLERFLAIFEGGFAETELGIADVSRYLDAEATPAPSLSWLGSWLAVAQDDSWSERSKRLLIERAPALFKRRGTRRGLLELLHIYLSGQPVSSPFGATSPGPTTSDSSTSTTGGTNWSSDERTDGGVERGLTGRERTYLDDAGSPAEHDHTVWIVEYGDVSDAPESGALAPFEELLSCPQEFGVIVGPTIDDAARAVIERIIDTEKPAHTRARIISLPPRARLGENTYLGVNTYLMRMEFVLGQSELGANSVLTEPDPGSVLGWKARLGDDLVIS